MIDPIPWLMNGLFTRFTADELLEIALWVYITDGEPIFRAFIHRLKVEYPQQYQQFYTRVKDDATVPKL